MVVKALGEIGDPGAVLPLIALLKSNMGTPISLVEHPVAMAVLDALGEIDDPRAVLPLAAAFKEKGSWWSSGIEVLRKMGEPAVELLLEALKDEASPVSDAAPLALGRLGDPRAVPVLIAALKDSRWNVREAAVQALDAFKDSRAVEPLCVLLEDGHESVRIAAAVALTGLGDSRAVPVLIAALQNCNESERDKAAVCLINLRDPAERLLSDMLQDSEPDVRMKAVHVLRDIYSRKLVVRTLKDKDAGVRSAAAQALGFIGETSELGHLEEALKDENEDVRKEAAAAIERFHERVNWSEAQRSRDDDENALRDAMNRSY
jgi:HEAT repeat protein